MGTDEVKFFLIYWVNFGEFEYFDQDITTAEVSILLIIKEPFL